MVADAVRATLQRLPESAAARRAKVLHDRLEHLLATQPRLACQVVADLQSLLVAHTLQASSDTSEGQAAEAESFVDHWWRLLRTPVAAMAGASTLDKPSASASTTAAASASSSASPLMTKGEGTVDDSAAVLAVVEADEREEAKRRRGGTKLGRLGDAQSPG